MDIDLEIMDCTEDAFAPHGKRPLNLTEEEKETLTSYERMIEKCTEVVRKAYDDNDLVVLKKVTRGNRQVNIERMDMIMKRLGKIKKVLVENLMQQEALFGEDAKAA